MIKAINKYGRLYTIDEDYSRYKKMWEKLKGLISKSDYEFNAFYQRFLETMERLEKEYGCGDK